MTLHKSEFFVQQQLTGCKLASTANVSGTYFNGSGNNGLGATLTTASTTLTLDSVDVVNGDYVLLNNQTTALENGIYQVSGVGGQVILTRRADFNSPSQMVPGFYVPIAAGSVNEGVIFTLTGAQVTQVGVSSISFQSSTSDINIHSVNLDNNGLNIYNPAGTFLNHIVPTSAITAARQFSLVTGDQNTSLDLTLAPTFAPSAYGATLVASADKFAAEANLGIRTGIQTGLPITLTTYSLLVSNIVATDIVMINLQSSPNPAYLIGAAPGPGYVQLTFNTAPGANSTVSYVAFATV